MFLAMAFRLGSWYSFFRKAGNSSDWSRRRAEDRRRSLASRPQLIAVATDSTTDKFRQIAKWLNCEAKPPYFSNALRKWAVIKTRKIGYPSLKAEALVVPTAYFAGVIAPPSYRVRVLGGRDGPRSLRQFRHDIGAVDRYGILSSCGIHRNRIGHILVAGDTYPKSSFPTREATHSRWDTLFSDKRPAYIRYFGYHRAIRGRKSPGHM